MTQKRQPIAIVGMACRFPGGCHTPEQYWELLCSGSDRITEIRTDRWSKEYYYHPDPKSSGKTYTAAAGQLDDIYDFDPEFFGISPREAAQMDPQQRLLLQMSWEALEDGAELPAALAGSNCSVYVGISSLDYANNRMDDPSVADAYFMTGNTLSIAANRISYIFDLHGPSMAIDTACSSSLVALHQACASIWSGESTSSIVGAVHLVLSPFPFIGFSKASMLSKNGRCSVFDAAADGYVRSEGGVVLYLKPLEQALRDGNRIHALIRATAVNSDGYTSAMTVPNGKAQASLLENLYRDTGIDCNDIDYIEAHGTGTPVGDPIETGALGQAIGMHRAPANPLRIGSVKTNIGHLEPASGFAGLLKVALSLEHRAIPATIHQQRPNPNIDFNGLNLRVVDRLVHLPESERPLIMGVNSFGFGGTNAHTILSAYRPDARTDNEPARRAAVLPPLFLSAMSEDSLKKRAAQFRALLDSEPSFDEFYDIAHAAACRRQKLKHGLVVCGDSIEQIRQGLGAGAEGKKSPYVVRTEPLAEEGSTAWIFSGNGSQWGGMGRGLLGNELFRDTIVRIDRYFEPLAGWSLLRELEDGNDTRLQATEVAQPLLFAVQLGIVAILRDSGLRADAVAGHSVGEIAAACVAGALTLEDAVRVIYHRSMAQGRTRGSGRMAAVRLSAERIRPILDGYHGKLEIAAINSQDSVTISGPADAIRSLVELLQQEAVSCRELDLEYAFHSRVMDDIRPYITAGLEIIEPVRAEVDFISTVAGCCLDGASLDADYWWRNIREPVQFADAVTSMINNGVRTFVEIGPHPVLQSYLRDMLRGHPVQGRVIRTLKRNDPDEILSVRIAAYKCVFSDERNRFDSIFPVAGKLVALPAYPWNNSRYVFNGSNEATNKTREHPLLGFRLNQVDGIWLNQIDTTSHPYLADHVVEGLVVFPAAGYIEMALAASRSWFGRDSGAVNALEIRKPMILEAGKTRVVQFQLSPKDMHFSIRSRERYSDGSWLEHATGRLVNALAVNRWKPLDFVRYDSDESVKIPSTQIYALAARCGLDYGPAFRRAISVSLEGGSTLTRLATGDEPAGRHEFLWHPALIDSALHALFVMLDRQYGEEALTNAWVPVEMQEVRFYGQGAGEMVWSECVIHSVSENIVRAGFIFYNGSGTAVAAIHECIFRKLPRQEKSRGTPGCYRYKLIPKNLLDPSVPTPLPGLDDLVEGLANIPALDELTGNEKILNDQLVPLLDALASSLAEHTLREFGAHLGHFTIDSLVAASGIDPEHSTYIAYLLGILEQDGKAICHDGQWKLPDSQEIEDPVEIWRSILADYPAYVDVLRGTAANCFRIKEILTGHRMTLPDGRASTGPLVTVPAHICLQQNLLRHIILTVVQQWAQNGRRLRIAEIRSSRSDGARDFVFMLPPDYCDYEILALDDRCISLAEEHYRDCVNVTISRFDPSRSAAQPKYREGEFDIVLIMDELYQFAALGEVLSHVSAMLASSGLLMLVEKKPDRITDLSMGLMDPDWWQRTVDRGRPVSSNLYPEDWSYLLENSGFEDVRNLSESLSAGGIRFLLSARRSARQVKDPLRVTDQQSSYLLVASGEGFSFELARSIKAELSRGGVRTMLAVDSIEGRAPAGLSSIDLLEPGTRLGSLLDVHNTLPLKILYLAGLNEKPGKMTSADIAEQVTRTNMKFLNLIRALGSVELKSKPVIWGVTSGALAGMSAESSGSSNPYQYGMWGLGRVIRNEYPEIDCRMIDLQSNGSTKQLTRLLIQETISGDGEEELVLADNDRLALRLDEFEPESRENPVMPDRSLRDYAESSHLEFSRAGSIDNLGWSAHARRLPADDEVEIEVRATGLNFRDIMFCSGLLPAEMLEGGYAGATLGLECSGVVTRTGAAVRSFQTGDEVIAMAPASFARHVIASKYAVIRKPAGWSFEAAATIPTAFFTTYYALHHMARLKAGERILIHGAAGGVGLAAIQYARYSGAEIFATAGTDEKRRFLELLGVDHVLNSRTLDFADRIMEITGSEGVDVVLNSLAGEAMFRSFNVLRPFGRFIELGKRDFYENTRMELKPFRNNIAYYGVDADQLLSHEPGMSKRLMEEVISLFEQGVFRPLPHTIFPASDVQSAFRYMQQSRQIGKVVVTQASGVPAVRKTASRIALELDPDANYLITGGMSGFGLATAEWLAGKGAKHIVLAGRRPVPSESALQAISALRDRNIDVRTVQCDVTDAIRLQTLLNDIQTSGIPLKGVIHAAMVIEDSLIRNMDVEMMRKVIAPKVQGAWNLHHLTSHLDLDLFVMYSSVTTCIGNPGQANYVSANAFLEALARFRRNSGMPATVVAWDAISDTGYLARNEQLAGRLSRKLGLAGITSMQALAMLETMLTTGTGEAVVMNPNWAALRQMLPVLNSNLYRNIMHGLESGGELSGEDLADVLARLPENERQPAVVGFLIREIARILQTAEEKIAHNASIQDMGIDSLMAMELAGSIEAKLGIDLPVMMLADNITIDALGSRIVNLLNPEPGSPVDNVGQIVSSLARIHAEELSTDEIESLSKVVDGDVHKTIRLIQ